MTNNNTNDTTSTMPTTGTAAPTSSATGALPRELVFIDATVPDVAVLVANVRPDVAVVLLNSASDPWQQMTAAISQYQELTAVHLVSHGQAGALVLNGQSYDSTSILAEKELLASWSAHLAVGADVLLYGCDVAAGDAGGSLLSALSRLTLTDVAASTNLTGASAAGGDWVLEQSTGAIQATSPFTSAIAQDYTQLLVSGIYSSTTGTNVDTAGVTSGLIGAGKLITFNPITVTATDPAAKLVIRAYDVDYGLKTAAGVPYAAGDANSEWDGVYIQKAGASSWTFVGYLNGTNNNWSYSTFDVSSIVNSTGDWLVRVVPDDNGTQTQTSNGGKWVVGTSIAEFFMGSGSLISSLTESGQSVTSQWNAPVGNYTIQYLLLDASGRAVAQVNSATSEIVANATQTNSTTLAVNTNFYSSWAAVPTGTYTLQATLIDAAGVVQDVKTISTPITGATSGSGTSSSSSSTTTNSSSGTNYTTITGNTSWTGSTAADLAHTATSDTTPTLTGYVYASSSSSSARTVNIYMDGVLLGSTTSSTTYDSTHHAYAWTFTPTTAISLGAHTFTASRSGGNYVQSSPYALTIDTAVTPAITGLTTASWTGSTIADLASQSNHAATPHTTGDKTPGIVGTAGPLTSLAIYDGATLLGYTTSDASGAWTFQVGDLLPLANGSHSFTAKDTSSTLTSSAFALAIDSTAPTQTISIASISADTGVSGDFITSVATQTINATLNSALLAGQRLLGSLDGGVTWIDATTAVSGTSIAWAGRTLKTGYADPTQLVAWAIEFKVVDSANQNGPIAAQDYQLIQSGGTPVITTIAASSASSVTTNFVRPVVTGTADPNTVVDIYAGTTLLGSAAVNASGNWTFSPVNNISSGTYTIKAIERDALTGYVSPDSGTKTLVINTTLPLLTLNTASDSGTYNSDAITSASTPSVHVDFSSLVNSGVGIVAGDTVQILKAGVQIGSATALTSTNVTNKYIDIATAALGSDANVTLTAKIVHGGVPYASNDLGVTLDTTAPVFASGTIDGSSVVLHYTEGVGLDPNAPTLSQFSVSIGGTATVPDSLIFDPVAKTVTLLLPSAATSTSTATVSYTPAASPSVKLLDLAGNAAVALNAQTLTNITDTTPPTLSSISPQNPASPTNADAVTFRVTFADASGGVSSVDANDFVAKLNGTAVAIAAVTQVSGLVYDVLVNDPAIAQANGNLVLSLATQTAGMYITDVSQAANLLANDTSRAGTYVLDNTAPSALSITSVTDDVGSITGALSNPGRTDDNNLLVRVNLTGSGAVAGDSVQLYAGSDTSSPLGSAYVLSSTDITHVYADLSTGTLENGITYTITARVADALGNQSVVSTNSFVETVDTTITNPVVSLTNDTTDGLSTHNTDLKSSSAVLTFNTKDADASRTFVVDSGNASGTYTAPTSQGSHTVTVTDLDTAGNTASASITFTLDSVAPALSTATVHGNTLVLSYADAGTGMSGKTPATSDYLVTVSAGGGATTFSPSSVTVDAVNQTVTLVLPNTTNSSDTVTLSYTAGVNPIQDIVGNAAGNLTGQAVNNTGNAVAPTTTVVISAMTHDSGAADFLTNDGAAGRTYSGMLSNALGVNEVLEYSLDGGLNWSQVSTVSGTSWSTNDAGGAHASNWSIKARVMDTVSTLTGAVANQSVVLDTAITNPVVSLTNDTTDGLSTHNTDLKSSSAVLTFNTKDADASRTFVVDSGNASGTYTAPTSQGPHTVTVTDLDTAGNTAGASITFTLDSVAPALNSATVHGNTLVLSYNEDGAGLSALSPSTGDFAITKGLGHDPVGVSSVAVDTLHKTLTLSLTSAIAITDSNILVSYTPGANPIGDIAGNTAAALVAQSVTNLTANTVSIGDVTVSESSPFAVFQLNLEAPAGGTVVFTPTLSSSGGAGYATLGTDTGSVLQYFNASSWTDVSGPIILASGTSHALFRVAISNDNVFEGRESFTFNTGSITGSANISNSTGASATGTIADDGSSANIFLSNNNTATPTTGIADSDLPVISVSSVTVSESQPYAMVSVSLSNSSTSAVSFTPVLSGGTTSGLATIGTDTGSSIEYFNGTSWQDATQGVVIAAGVQSIQLRVSIVQDALYNEGTETFTVSTGSITAGAVSNAAGASGIVSITDVSALRDPVITDVLETNTDPTPYDLLTAQTLQVVTLTGESGCTVTLFRLNDNTHDPVAVIAPGFTTAEAAGSSLSTYTLDFHANSLPAGEYEVRLSKNGYSSHYSNSFTIDSTPGLYDITGQRANVKISDAITVTNGAVGGMDQNRMPGHWNGTDWLDSDGQTIRFSQDALITFVQGSAPADSVVMTTASSGSTLALHTETGAYTYTPSATAINTGALDTFTLFASDGGKGASLPLTFDPKDSLDRDGIPALVETQLGNLAGASGDMNHDGILDANQNAVATLAWTTVDQYTAAINGTLSSAAPVISVVVAQSTSGSAVDASSQLADVKVLDPQSAVVGGSKPANATWDPIQFTVAPLQSMGLQDADPSRPGTQVRILIDVSQDNLPASSFNGYMKYVNQAAVTAGVSDLVGNQITTPGWYDFTQRVSGGDGARFITSGGVLTAIELTITDNAFGDDNPVIGQIFDPGVPVNNVPAPPAPPAPPLLNTPPPPPAVPTVLSQVTNNTHPLISGTASLAMGETLTVTVNGAIYTNVPVTAGGWSLNLASATPSSGVLGTFVDGQVYSVTATALAIAGGTSTDTTSNELTIDTTPPVVPTVNSQITSNTHPTITGTATLATGETLTVTVNGATFANVPVTSGLWSLNTATVKPTNGVLGGFVDGHVYSVTATASDVAGNTSTDRSSSELIIDTSSPVVPTVSSQTTSNTHPVITGTAALGSGETLTVTVNGATYTNVPVISGSWSLNTGTAIPASGALGSFVAGHVYSVIATALDAAGNTSTDTTNNELTLSNPTQPVYALLLPSGDRWLTSSAADAHQLGQMLHSGKAEVDFYVSSQVMPNALELKAWHNVVTGDYLYLPASVALPYSCYQPTSDTTLGYVMAPGKGAFDVHLYLNAWGVTQLMGQGQATQLGLLSQGYMDVGAVFSSLPADDSVQPVTLVGQTVVV
jgi:uncharacterized repeat protein (TIGR02059 family)